jgi:hypothetical protein
MMFLRKKTQSILEYAILIAIVIAAVVVMQVYMKRGISGRLKESSDKISGGEAFSASGTTTFQSSNMDISKPRIITEETGTDGNASAVASTMTYDGQSKMTKLGLKDSGGYSAGSSSGGDTASNSASRTLDASHEAFQANNVAQDATTTTVDDFKSGQ